LCLVASVIETGDIGFSRADLAMLRDQDCLHQYMYLPPEGPWSERVVAFLQAQPIRYCLLDRSAKQTQLTYRPNQQLMRKLTIFYSTAHVAAADFRPIADDFPDGFD
jgi:hypothetical protein